MEKQDWASTTGKVRKYEDVESVFGPLTLLCDDMVVKSGENSIHGHRLIIMKLSNIIYLELRILNSKAHTPGIYN